MSKKEKIITFEQMNRKEYVSDTVTGVMVAGILICVLRGLTHFLIQWTGDLIPGGGWQFYIRTLLSAVISALSLAVPLWIYGLAVDSKLKKVFSSKGTVSTVKKISVGLIGILSAVAAAILCLKGSFLLMDAARSVGYVFTVSAPDIGNGTAQNVFYIIIYAIVPALICEPVFRGVLMNRLSGDSYLLAVLIPSLIFAANHPTIPQMPYMVAVGVILGWTYLKTEDIWVPVCIHAITNGVIGWLYVTDGSPEAFTLELGWGTFVLLAVVLVGSVIFAALSPLKPHEQESRPFSIKESLRGLLGTFGIYVLIIVVAFQLGAWHIDNPSFEIGDADDGSTRSQQQESDSSSAQDLTVE